MAIMVNEKMKIDFIGIGAVKSATTWVAKCLEDHPDILFASEKSRKELSFFNSSSNWQGEGGYDLSTWDKGMDWYLKQFPAPQPGKVRGEFTVTYLIDSLACGRIYEAFPDVKLIVVLRNPIDMMYSLHNFGSSSAVAEVRQSFEEMVEDGRRLPLGKYHQHLKRFYNRFPHENIYVTILDDIKKNGVIEIQKIYRFLGVDDSFIPPSFNTKVNVAFKPRYNFIRNIIHVILRKLHKVNRKLYFKILDNDNLASFYTKFNKVKYKYPKLSSEMRNKLIDYYKDDINQLEKLINKNLSPWKTRS